MASNVCIVALLRVPTAIRSRDHFRDLRAAGHLVFQERRSARRLCRSASASGAYESVGTLSRTSAAAGSRRAVSHRKRQRAPLRQAQDNALGRNTQGQAGTDARSPEGERLCAAHPARRLGRKHVPHAFRGPASSRGEPTGRRSSNATVPSPCASTTSPTGSGTSTASVGYRRLFPTCDPSPARPVPSCSRCALMFRRPSTRRVREPAGIDDRASTRPRAAERGWLVAASRPHARR